jgi:putative transposase
MEIIRIVEDSELSTRQTLKELGINRGTFYNWYHRYLEDGVEGLGPKKPKARTFWNKIPKESDKKKNPRYEEKTKPQKKGRLT